jgi:hypothetical protein
VYDILGREVATLVDGVKAAGVYSIQWDSKNLPSGIYLCRLSVGNSQVTKKMNLLR